MSSYRALSVHSFMGALTLGVSESIEPVATMETFDLGELTVEANLGIPFYRAGVEASDRVPAWFELLEDPRLRDVQVVFGNPRCTGFSALGHGCSEDAHGAWAKPTVDIRQLCEVADLVQPPVWGFESVQQCGTVGRDLIQWIYERFKERYRLAELYHNAAQFGSSQHRRRVFMMFYDRELEPPFEELTESCLWRGAHRTVYDVIGDLRDVPTVELPSDFSYPTTLGEAIAVGLPLNHWHKHGRDRYFQAAVETTLEGHSLNGVPEEVLEQAGYEDLAEKKAVGTSFSWHAPRRLHRDRSCPVVYSASGKFLHPELPRALTVRELARLMGCPDSWVVLGPDPIAQLGKGVTVEVGRWLGRLFRATLEGHRGPRQPDHVAFRFDRDYGWTPKRPRVEAEAYDDVEEEA